MLQILKEKLSGRKNSQILSFGLNFGGKAFFFQNFRNSLALFQNSNSHHILKHMQTSGLHGSQHLAKGRSQDFISEGPRGGSGGPSPADAGKISKICKDFLKIIAKNALFQPILHKILQICVTFSLIWKEKLKLLGKF